MVGHICFSVIENCKNYHDSYGEICVGCNACGRINKDTALECWLAVEKEHQQENENHLNGIGFELEEEPQIRALQLRNMKSNVRYYKKKIAEIERLIAQRDKK